MPVTLDGMAIRLLKPSGLARVKKSRFKISVSGRRALFKVLRVWSVQR
jgi:hypothetical protein